MGQFEYAYDLTGTPTPKGLEDIYGQAYTMDGGAALGASNITQFRKKYMVPLYTLHGRVTVYGERDGARKEIAKKIYSRVSRLKKTEHLKLPPLNFHKVVVAMPPDLEDMYRELEENFYIEVGDKPIETFSQVATDMKLRQFLQGRVYDADGVALIVHNEKAKALKKLKLKGNSLIAYNFKFERDDLRSFLGNTPFLDSRTKDSESEKWIIGWNNYEFPHFLVNPASAAYGLNLQAGGCNVVWYSLTWNAEHYSQLIDRLWRQGQRNPVNVYHIVFENTMDEVLADSLSKKDGDQAALMADIVGYINGKH
jgi:SNF2 family DNA or RNA helicase